MSYLPFQFPEWWICLLCGTEQAVDYEEDWARHHQQSCEIRMCRGWRCPECEETSTDDEYCSSCGWYNDPN